MPSVFLLFLELSLVFTISFCIVSSISKSKAIIFAAGLIGSLAVGAVLGYPKSTYHLLLIVVAAICTKSHWSAASRRASNIAAQLCLFFIAAIALTNAEWSMQDKNKSPQFFAIWGLILINSNRPWASLVARLFMIFDILLSYISSARGILLGSVSALGLSGKNHSRIKKYISTIAAATFFIYLLAVPIILATNKVDKLENSASNAQRALMNYHALMDSKFITMSETAIFDSAEPLRYAHDDERLTVHNLFLAFALFNGLIPAAILFISVITMISKISDSRLIPLGFYLYLVITLGPDSSQTRISLLLLCALCITLSKRHERNSTSEPLIPK